MLSLSRKNFRASGNKIVQSEELQKPVLGALAKQVFREMKSSSSTSSVTLLRDSDEALKQFSWESIWLEIRGKLPILLSFLQQVLPKAKKRFICFLVCMMLKNHCKHLSLVQRAVSVLFYGNGCHKQVSWAISVKSSIS